MSLFEVLTDDQLAVIGCVASLVVAFGVMSLTWTVRSAVTSTSEESLQTAPVRSKAFDTTVIADRKAA